MRFPHVFAAVMLIFCQILIPTGWAQDDLDFEALLNDLTAEEVEPAAEEPVDDSDSSVQEDVEQMPFDEPVDMSGGQAEPEMVPSEPSMIEESDMVEEVETVQSAVEEPVVEEVEIVEEMDEADEPVMMADEVDPQVTALAEQEKVRRQAMEQRGLIALEEGFTALSTKEYEAARSKFEEAIKNIPVRPSSQKDLQMAQKGLAEASYGLANEIYRGNMEGEVEDAVGYAKDAVSISPDDRSYSRLLDKLLRQQKKLEKLAELPTPPTERPDVKERMETVEELIYEGKQFYEIQDYQAAEAIFEKVLIEDPYNTDAMRFLSKIEKDRYAIASTEREATVDGAMRQVRDTWNPPLLEEVQLPPEIRETSATAAKTQAELVRQKMSDIMIPSIEFRQANIRDVVNFLVEASIAGDPDQEGVNIILNLNPGGRGASQETQSTPSRRQQDDFGGGFDEWDEFENAQDTGMDFSGSSDIPTITLNLRRISLLDSLKIITEVAGLRYRIDGNVVIITPVNVALGPVVTRLYPVQPTLLDVIVERSEEDTDRDNEFITMGQNSAQVKKGDVKEFFTKAGVPFPVGTSITYNPGISQLIVANTPENLEIFERVLSQLNVIPNQVEIEARFVEIAQNDLQEAGLEWILNDNWEVARNDNGLPVASQERIQVDANQNGLTQGLRFFGADQTTGALQPASAITRGAANALGGILSISSILTNPEMKLVLHALSQSGNSDLLSAPRVTTRSGVNAQIEVVQEIIYPTEFESEVTTISQTTGDVENERNIVVITPGGFETRETGVILNVTPTVGPDGYTIDLSLIPEVAELVDWIQYGSTVEGTTYNMPQPIFSSRNVSTSIVIWDGQTVVMGGLMREDLVTVKDKVPLLGDIPILGRLFRSEGEYSRKRNLLIFVTARLVDPAGKPIHRADSGPGMQQAGGMPDAMAQ